MKLATIRNIARIRNLFWIKLLIYHWFYRLFGFNILTNQFIRLCVLKRVDIQGMLLYAIDKTGFTRNNRGVLNIKGKLNIRGSVSLGPGCRFDIGKAAEITLCDAFVNEDTIFSIHHGLQVGAGTSVGWNCLFLDDDFHEVVFDNQHNDNKDVKQGIKIGSRVLIANNVSIYKNVVIADGCVVASNSIVKGKFTEPNCLIAGCPARVVKQNIHHWT